MKTKDYLRVLKKELEFALSKHSHTIKLKEHNNLIIVDITVNHTGTRVYMQSNLIYHDVISMPKEFTYGIARVQASLIINSMYGVISTYFL